MDNGEVQVIGNSCGQHGPYTFYRAFKYLKNGLHRIVKIGEFFFVKLWSDSDLMCIGELQLLWVDKNSEQVLSSLRLYFLPENTPEGRMDHGEAAGTSQTGASGYRLGGLHRPIRRVWTTFRLPGETTCRGKPKGKLVCVDGPLRDEVLAISEKVVLRLEDLITWITTETEWNWGRLAKCDSEVKEPKYDEDLKDCEIKIEKSLDILEIEKEQSLIDEKSNSRPTVVILSYPSYCRYRSIMKRLEGVEDDYLKHTVVKLLGGFTVPHKNTRILFCRETFDYPELEGHELLCNHLAPKLKGRPRGRRKKRSLSPGSESNESESSISNVGSNKNKIMTEGNPNGFRSECGISTRRSTRSLIVNTESKEFLVKLFAFMKSNHTPIGRIPSLGYKELDLHSFFTKVDKLGGYEAVTSNRLWKSIFDDLSGNYISTSAATVIRRHYEKFLLPYERHLKGEEYKPISSGKRSKCYSGSVSDAETSESTSCSGNSTPVPQLVSQSLPSTSKDADKISKILSSSDKKKPEQKTSSLRSVRVKSDRVRDSSTPKEKSTKSAYSTSADNKNKVVNQNEKVVKETKTNLTVELIDKVLDVKESKDVPKDLLVKKEEVVEVTDSSVSEVKESNETLPSDDVKENIATCNTNSVSPTNNKNSDIDLTEVPYKPKTEIKRESDVSINSSLLNSFKKRKLDILKEGGLEVTPVKPCSDTPKDDRPSVIHPPNSLTTTVGQLSITLTPEKVENSTLNGNLNSLEISPNNSFKIGKSLTPIKSPYSHLNGKTPPIQSKSIYSYSEKTVYGNPKDYFMPPPRPPPQVPKLMAPYKQTGGEILDLTIKSPQKPVVEIMRVPASASRVSSNHKESYRKNFKNISASLPVLDARVGSNLEITLVGSNNQSNTNNSHHASKTSHKHNFIQPGPPPTSNSNHLYGHLNMNSKSPHKRSTSSSSSSTSSKRENGRTSYPMTPPQHPYLQQDIRHRHQSNYNSSRSTKLPTPTAPNQNVPKSHSHNSVLPEYLTQLSLASKMMPPFVPTMDPLYYSALQGLYPPSALPSVSPFFPVPSPEQLQFYTELMAHNSQMRFPFPYSRDNNAALSNGNKDSSYKKQ